METHDTDEPPAPDAGAPLADNELAAYFALMDTANLLQHAVDVDLRAAGDLTYIQFQILARLVYTADGALRMTDLADLIVYSRSGLTYQAGLLETRGLLARSPSPTDERSVLVTITPTGRQLVQRLMPGHRALVRRLLIDSLEPQEIALLGTTLGRARDQLRRTAPLQVKATRGPSAT